MASYSKLRLSGSTDGRGIKVAATSIASGTTIHTAPVSGLDLVTLFVHNSDTAAVTLTVGWGGTTDPDDLIRLSIPSRSGMTLVTEQLPISSSLIVRAAGSVADKLVVFGWVNRIS